MSWLIGEGLIEHGKAKDKAENLSSHHEDIAKAMYCELKDAPADKLPFVLMRMYTDESFLY